MHLLAHVFAEFIKDVTFRYCSSAVVSVLGLPSLLFSSTCLVSSDFFKDKLYSMTRCSTFSALGTLLVKKKKILFYASHTVLFLAFLTKAN